MTEGLIKDLLPTHAHWVNTMSLNTNYTMRYCFFDSEDLKTKVPTKEVM